MTSLHIESWMYTIGQLFLIPTLLAIALLFFYSLFAFGQFAMAHFQRRQLRLGAAAAHSSAYPLLRWAGQHPGASADERDLAAHRLLEVPRVATRVTPMLGLVATMIPMGPALKSISSGDIAAVADNLAVAFSAVILALIASALTYWIVSVRRRWLAEELVWLQQNAAVSAPALAPGALAQTAQTGVHA